MRHCPSCTCDNPVPSSAFRDRQRRLFSGVPDIGCLDYDHLYGYCGLPCEAGKDFCEKHRKPIPKTLRLFE